MKIPARETTRHNLATARRRRSLSMSPQRVHCLAQRDIGCQHDLQWITMTIGLPASEKQNAGAKPMLHSGAGIESLLTDGRGLTAAITAAAASGKATAAFFARLGFVDRQRTSVVIFPV